MQTYGECPQCRAPIAPASTVCPVCGATTNARPSLGAAATDPSGPPAWSGGHHPSHHHQPHGHHHVNPIGQTELPGYAPAPQQPAPPTMQSAKRKGGMPIGLIIGVVMACAVIAAIVVLVLKKSGDDDGGSGKKHASGQKDKDKDKGEKGEKGTDTTGDATGDKPAEGNDAEYNAAAEPNIPGSAEFGRIDPKELAKGPGRAVKPTAKEVDTSDTFAFAPDTDPYCKTEPGLADLLKQVGYDIDKELRSTAAMSDADEEKIGDKIFKELTQHPKFRGKIDMPGMAQYKRYIAELAVPLLVNVERKGIVYDFHTVDDPTINAFAIPGGHIFFYRGILEKPRRLENEAQLAGVLAHEINHIDRRHTIAIFEYLKKLGGSDGGSEADQIGQIIVAMARHPFSTTQEDESDTFAVKFLMAAEYSPKEFVRMWRTWDELEKKRPQGGGSNPLEEGLEALLATHSAPSRRACNAMRVTMSNKKPNVQRYYVGTSNFQQKKTRKTQQF